MAFQYNGGASALTNIKQRLAKIFPLIKNICIPAVLFACALMYFYAGGTSETNLLQTFHVTFFALVFTTFITLLYFNRSKPAFFLLTLTVSYVCINHLKILNGDTYQTSAAYINLCLFVPLNLGILFFLPERRLLTGTNVYILLILFAELSVNEFLSRGNIKLNICLGDGHFAGLSALGLLAYLPVLAAAFYKISRDGPILEYTLFFAILSTLFGFFYSDSAAALTVFYGMAALSILIAVAREIYYRTYKDTLTGLPGRYAFVINSQNFPLKYSLALISIDGYERWLNIFGRRDRDNLVRMIVMRIAEDEDENNIYRYNEDELIIVFKNEGKKDIAERTEQIRRSIASAEFMISKRKKAVKITVSTCISEKKRSDANSLEVVYRTRKALQKANEFSHNVSTSA